MPDSTAPREPYDAYRAGQPIGYSDGHDAACDGPPLTVKACPACGAHLAPARAVGVPPAMCPVGPYVCELHAGHKGPHYVTPWYLQGA